MVKTSKTGQTAEIPMLPLLRMAIEGEDKTGSEFVFPEAAESELLPVVSNDQVRRLGLKAIDKSSMTKGKRKRIRKTLL